MNVIINLLMGPNMWSPCFSHSLQSFTQPNLINHLLCNPLIKGQLSYGVGLPRCLSGEEPACQSWDTSSAPGSGRSPGVRWQPAAVFSSRKIPRAEDPGRLQSMETKESDVTEHAQTHTHTTDFSLFKSRCVCVSSYFYTVLAYKNSEIKYQNESYNTE